MRTAQLDVAQSSGKVVEGNDRSRTIRQALDCAGADPSLRVSNDRVVVKRFPAPLVVRADFFRMVARSCGADAPVRGGWLS